MKKELKQESLKSLLAFICANSRIPYLQYVELSKGFWDTRSSFYE